MKKIFFLFAAVSILFGPKAFSTIGTEADIRFPRVRLTIGVAFDCAQDGVFSALENNVGYITFLHDRFDKLLVDKEARINVAGWSTGGGEQNYGYQIFVDGKVVADVSDRNILGVSEDKALDNVIDKNIFYQRLIDDLARSLGIKKVAVSQEAFPKVAVTIQLASFDTERKAIKFAKGLLKKFEGYDEEPFRGNENDSYCSNCLVNDLFGDGGAYPPLFVHNDKGTWKVSYGLFLNREYAGEEVKNLKKIIGGETFIKDIDVNRSIFKKQAYSWYKPC